MTAADSLSVWLRVRREVDWRHSPALRRGLAGRDGFRSWCADGPAGAADLATLIGVLNRRRR
ncbi:hypothetical protein ABZ895_16045 [Streptomyces californicus]|uniref:hypothetical protein n=1 Tax=Streptomyces californicus TaxID=67351 RepID=UPI0033D0CCF8